MKWSKITKSDFIYDDHGRAILGSAKEMAAWVKLGFAEQNKKRSPLIPVNVLFSASGNEI